MERKAQYLLVEFMENHMNLLPLDHQTVSRFHENFTQTIVDFPQNMFLFQPSHFFEISLKVDVRRKMTFI